MPLSSIPRSHPRIAPSNFGAVTEIYNRDSNSVLAMNQVPKLGIALNKRSVPSNMMVPQAMFTDPYIDEVITVDEAKDDATSLANGSATPVYSSFKYAAGVYVGVMDNFPVVTRDFNKFHFIPFPGITRGGGEVSVQISGSYVSIQQIGVDPINDMFYAHTGGAGAYCSPDGFKWYKMENSLSSYLSNPWGGIAARGSIIAAGRYSSNGQLAVGGTLDRFTLVTGGIWKSTASTTSGYAKAVFINNSNEIFVTNGVVLAKTSDLVNSVIVYDDAVSTAYNGTPIYMKTLSDHHIIAYKAPGLTSFEFKLAYSTDDGANWTRTIVQLPDAVSSESCFATMDNKLYFLSGRRLFNSTDFGQTWTEVIMSKDDSTLTCTAFDSGSGYTNIHFGSIYGVNNRLIISLNNGYNANSHFGIMSCDAINWVGITPDKSLRNNILANSPDIPVLNGNLITSSSYSILPMGNRVIGIHSNGSFAEITEDVINFKAPLVAKNFNATTLPHDSTSPGSTVKVVHKFSETSAVVVRNMAIEFTTDAGLTWQSVAASATTPETLNTFGTVISTIAPNGDLVVLGGELTGKYLQTRPGIVIKDPSSVANLADAVQVFSFNVPTTVNIKKVDGSGTISIADRQPGKAAPAIRNICRIGSTYYYIQTIQNTQLSTELSRTNIWVVFSSTDLVNWTQVGEIPSTYGVAGSYSMYSPEAADKVFIWLDNGMHVTTDFINYTPVTIGEEINASLFGNARFISDLTNRNFCMIVCPNGTNMLPSYFTTDGGATWKKTTYEGSLPLLLLQYTGTVLNVGTADVKKFSDGKYYFNSFYKSASLDTQTGNIKIHRKAGISVSYSNVNNIFYHGTSRSPINDIAVTGGAVELANGKLQTAHLTPMSPNSVFRADKYEVCNVGNNQVVYRTYPGKFKTFLPIRNYTFGDIDRNKYSPIIANVNDSYGSNGNGCYLDAETGKFYALVGVNTGTFRCFMAVFDLIAGTVDTSREITTSNAPRIFTAAGTSLDMWIRKVNGKFVLANLNNSAASNAATDHGIFYVTTDFSTFTEVSPLQMLGNETFQTKSDKWKIPVQNKTRFAMHSDNAAVAWIDQGLDPAVATNWNYRPNASRMIISYVNDSQNIWPSYISNTVLGVIYQQLDSINHQETQIARPTYFGLYSTIYQPRLSTVFSIGKMTYLWLSNNIILESENLLLWRQVGYSAIFSRMNNTVIYPDGTFEHVFPRFIGKGKQLVCYQKLIRRTVDNGWFFVDNEDVTPDSPYIKSITIGGNE